MLMPKTNKISKNAYFRSIPQIHDLREWWKMHILKVVIADTVKQPFEITEIASSH